MCIHGELAGVKYDKPHAKKLVCAVNLEFKWSGTQKQYVRMNEPYILELDLTNRYWRTLANSMRLDGTYTVKPAADGLKIVGQKAEPHYAWQPDESEVMDMLKFKCAREWALEGLYHPWFENDGVSPDISHVFPEFPTVTEGMTSEDLLKAYENTQAQ